MIGRLNRRFGPPWAQRDWGHPGHPRFFGLHGPHRHHRHEISPEQLALRSTAAEVARLFMIAGRSAVGNAEKQAQLRAFLERSRKELSDLIYGTNQSTGTDTPTNVEQA